MLKESNEMSKYKYVKILQSNHGYGWDDVIEFEIKDGVRERKQMLRTYRENQSNASHRIVGIRVLNEDIKQC